MLACLPVQPPVWAELGPLLERSFERPGTGRYDEVRAGDQRVFISDICKAERELGWKPQIGVEKGFGRLFTWLREHDKIVVQ